MRRACKYILHSSGQLYSHKRKHEKNNIDDLNMYAQLSIDSVEQNNSKYDSFNSFTDNNEFDDINLESNVQNSKLLLNKNKIDEEISIKMSKPVFFPRSIKESAISPSSSYGGRIKRKNLMGSNLHIKNETLDNLGVSNADGFFNRKRGRPPKNRCFQVLNVSFLK